MHLQFSKNMAVLTSERTNESGWLDWKSCIVCQLTMMEHLRNPLIFDFWLLKIIVVSWQHMFVIFVLKYLLQLKFKVPESVLWSWLVRPLASLFCAFPVLNLTLWKPLVSAWVNSEPQTTAYRQYLVMLSLQVGILWRPMWHQAAHG